MTKFLIFGIFLLILAHILTWLQVNLQFINIWAKNNIFLMSLLGVPISILCIKATQLFSENYNGLIWPGRIIGFSIGTIIFVIMTYIILNEGVNYKTIISLILSLVILYVQIFLK